MNPAIGRQAEQYRRKAEEVLATADETRDLVSREALRRLADGYDRLAENLERVAARTASGEPEESTGS
jgi:hypothetical protein